MSALVRIRMALWALVALVAIGSVVIFAMKPPAGGPGLTGRPFTLEATDGTVFTEASFTGTPTVMLFGYTFCPDVCPTSLAELAGYRERLGLRPDQLRIVFATVDPKRDTPGVLKAYLAGFGTPMLGLTGTEAQVDQAKAAFGVYAKAVGGDGKGDYLVNHTATVFLIDSEGHFRDSIAYGEESGSAIAKIKRLAGA